LTTRGGAMEAVERDCEEGEDDRRRPARGSEGWEV
jgi:hypothetical protein